MGITAYPLLNTRRRIRKGFKSAIASYIQTCQCTQAELNLNTIEAKNCTVGDCIHIMFLDSQEEQAWAIASEQKNLQYWKEKMEGCNTYMEEECAEYQQQIYKCQQRINLIRDSHPEGIASYYDSWNQKQIVAIYVVCNYKIYLPKNKRSEVLTETFIMTPDGETVIGKEPYGKLSLARKKAN